MASRSQILGLLVTTLTLCCTTAQVAGSEIISDGCPAAKSGSLPTGTIIDISVGLDEKTPMVYSENGIPGLRVLEKSMADGYPGYMSSISFSAHFGTHVDAPGHFIQEYYERGHGIQNLDLNVLNGPALVVEVYGTNITAAVLESLNLPKGLTRIIFKTDATKDGLLHYTPFVQNYTALTLDGCEWIVENTDIKFIAVDYMSISNWDALYTGHIVILKKEIIIVEAVLLDDVEPGLYTVHCLPIKINGSEGAPARCILVT